MSISETGAGYNSCLRPFLRAARRRYQTARPGDRPNLADPASCCGLFGPAAMAALAWAGCWPLPAAICRRLAEPPADRARRRRRRAEQVTALVRPGIARELPAALARLNGRARP